MKKELTCIICPKGCKISVEYEDKNILSVKGNTCNRGLAYAHDETLDPKRTITTTVLADDGSIVSVKTDSPVKKDMIFECMDAINSVKIQLPVSVGDVIINNILGTDVNVVATCNRK